MQHGWTRLEVTNNSMGGSGGDGVRQRRDKGQGTVPICRAQALAQALVQPRILRKRFHCYG